MEKPRAHNERQMNGLGHTDEWLKSIDIDLSFGWASVSMALNIGQHKIDCQAANIQRTWCDRGKWRDREKERGWKEQRKWFREENRYNGESIVTCQLAAKWWSCWAREWIHAPNFIIFLSVASVQHFCFLIPRASPLNRKDSSVSTLMWCACSCRKKFIFRKWVKILERYQNVMARCRSSYSLLSKDDHFDRNKLLLSTTLEEKKEAYTN